MRGNKLAPTLVCTICITLVLELELELIRRAHALPRTRTHRQSPLRSSTMMHPTNRSTRWSLSISVRLESMGVLVLSLPCLLAWPIGSPARGLQTLWSWITSRRPKTTVDSRWPTLRRIDCTGSCTSWWLHPCESLPWAPYADASRRGTGWLASCSTNIPGNQVAKGEQVAPWLQPLPAKGTGEHRIAFMLCAQQRQIAFPAAESFDSRSTWAQRSRWSALANALAYIRVLQSSSRPPRCWSSTAWLRAAWRSSEPSGTSQWASTLLRSTLSSQSTPRRNKPTRLSSARAAKCRSLGSDLQLSRYTGSRAILFVQYNPQVCQDPSSEEYLYSYQVVKGYLYWYQVVKDISIDIK